MGLLRSLVSGRPDPVLSASRDVVLADGTIFSVDGETLPDVLPTEASGVSLPAEIFGLSNYASPIAPAPRVDRRSALQVAAVKRSRDLIAGSLGTLPLVTVRPDRTIDRTSWLTQPERDVPRSVTMTRTVEDLLLESVAWWFVSGFDYRGFPSEVVRLDPRTVDVQKDSRVRVTLDGRRGIADEWPTDGQLIRFDSPNDPLLVAGARAIRQCLLLDQAAQRYAEGAPPLDYFSPRDGVDVGDDDEIRDILDAWQRARQTRSTGYIPAALEYTNAGWNPEQLQLAEARQHAVLEIARVAGIDPEELGVSTTSRTYANAQDRRKAFLDFTLGAYRAAVEDRLSMGDVTPRGSVVKFDLSDFLRSDDKTRYEAALLGIKAGALTRPEVRAGEGKPPLTAEQEKEAEQMPEPTPSQPTEAEREEVVATFDDHAAVVTFDAPNAPEVFSVDRETRTIRGLAVPYGVVSNDGRTFQFSKGSITYGIPQRIKLLVGHDWSQAVGHAVTLEDTDEGLMASFKVARGAEGDRVLSLAEDGVYDGLSVGIGHGMKTRVINGVQHVLSAPLREISATPAPAFDGARVTEVAASHQTRGTIMPCASCGVVHAAGVTECTAADLATFAAQHPEPESTNFSAITTAIEAGFANLTNPQGPGRQVVSAGAPLQISEPAPYRFDGTTGEHDFSHDVIAVLRGDTEARQRVQTFMAEELDPVNFAVGSTDVADLNPARNRPDMYVDRLVATTPLWEALKKGSLADNTPFIFPKFGDASGLVDDHQEMVEPTPGSFTAGKQTVTPSPLSGKVEIPREIIDAGGNPQVSSLIWREMQRAYFEALEGKVAAMLAASNPMQINLTAGAQDSDLVDELEAAYASLQFVPGGFRFDYAPTHQGLYQALAAASDDAGRKLLPILQPANANGTAATRFASLNVAGVQHLPVASLGAAGTGLKRSYLIASEDVHAWASPPRELRFEYQVAHVDLGIWGYVATAISRTDGVRRISYNTVAA